MSKVFFTKEDLTVLLEKMAGGSFAKLAAMMKKLGRLELNEDKLKDIIGVNYVMKKLKEEPVEPVKNKTAEEQLEAVEPERKKDFNGGVSYYEKPWKGKQPPQLKKSERYDPNNPDGIPY